MSTESIDARKVFQTLNKLKMSFRDVFGLLCHRSNPILSWMLFQPQVNKRVLMDAWYVPAVMLGGHWWDTFASSPACFNLTTLLICSLLLWLRTMFTTFQIFNHTKYLMRKDFHLWGNHKPTIQCKLNCVIMDSCERSWLTEGGCRDFLINRDWERIAPHLDFVAFLLRVTVRMFLNHSYADTP